MEWVKYEIDSFVGLLDDRETDRQADRRADGPTDRYIAVKVQSVFDSVGNARAR